ncbi:MAG TPA: pitrilysin family protein [Chloroflexota bacterium]|nr:pitrilysin family protein [Chloroflexota bacterium]
MSGESPRFDAATTAAPPSRGARLEIRRATLSNGLVVLGSENRVHPSVVMRLSLRAGAVLNHPQRAGLATLTASGLTRGTRSRTFDDLNETIDGAGMSLSSSAGRHLAGVSSRCLAEDLDLAIELMADVTRNPIFPEAEIERLRAQVLTGLRQADDDTGAVADRHFRERLYPSGHPYRLRPHGYQETVSALRASDLAEFHAQSYGPGQAFFVVVGDVDFEAMVARLEAAFGDWRGASIPAAATAAVEAPPPPEAGQVDVVLAGKTQSDLVLGRPGIPRRHPDYYALRLANLIFGRLGMMGRLGDTVREAKGLAYSVYSELDANVGPGPWAVRAGVNPGNVDAALEGIREELHRLRDGGVTEDELQRGQRYSTGSLVLQLETNDGVAGVIQDIEFFGLGLDFIERYPSIVNGLTLEAVNQAAATHLPRLEETVRVVAGPQRP